MFRKALPILILPLILMCSSENRIRVSGTPVESGGPGVQRTCLSPACLKISWVDSMSSSAGYYVHFGTTSGVYTEVVDVGLANVWTLTDLISNQNYCVAVSSYSGTPGQPDFVQSNVSNEICAQTL